VRVFIGVSARLYMSICVYVTSRKKKKRIYCCCEYTIDPFKTLFIDKICVSDHFLAYLRSPFT
jgi:hypothetical protein